MVQLKAYHGNSTKAQKLFIWHLWKAEEKASAFYPACGVFFPALQTNRACMCELVNVSVALRALLYAVMSCCCFCMLEAAAEAADSFVVILGLIFCLLKACYFILLLYTVFNSFFPSPLFFSFLSSYMWKDGCVCVSGIDKSTSWTGRQTARLHHMEQDHSNFAGFFYPASPVTIRK